MCARGKRGERPFAVQTGPTKGHQDREDRRGDTGAVGRRGEETPSNYKGGVLHNGKTTTGSLISKEPLYDEKPFLHILTHNCRLVYTILGCKHLSLLSNLQHGLYQAITIAKLQRLLSAYSILGSGHETRNTLYIALTEFLSKMISSNLLMKS